MRAISPEHAALLHGISWDQRLGAGPTGDAGCRAMDYGQNKRFKILLSSNYTLNPESLVVYVQQVETEIVVFGGFPLKTIAFNSVVDVWEISPLGKFFSAVAGRGRCAKSGWRECVFWNGTFGFLLRVSNIWLGFWCIVCMWRKFAKVGRVMVAWSLTGIPACAPLVRFAAGGAVSAVRPAGPPLLVWSCHE